MILNLNQKLFQYFLILLIIYKLINTIYQSINNLLFIIYFNKLNLYQLFKHQFLLTLHNQFIITIIIHYSLYI